jgi:hypothetical protein
VGVKKGSHHFNISPPEPIGGQVPDHVRDDSGFFLLEDPVFIKVRELIITVESNS